MKLLLTLYCNYCLCPPPAGVQVLAVSVTAAYMHALWGFGTGSVAMARRTVAGAMHAGLFAGGRAAGLAAAGAKFLLL